MPNFTSGRNLLKLRDWILNRLSLKADKTSVYTKSEIDAMSERTGNIYTYEEVKLMKDGSVVTPYVVSDSIYEQDGTKYKDNIYTKTEIDNIISKIT